MFLSADLATRPTPTPSAKECRSDVWLRCSLHPLWDHELPHDFPVKKSSRAMKKPVRTTYCNIFSFPSIQTQCLSVSLILISRNVSPTGQFIPCNKHYLPHTHDQRGEQLRRRKTWERSVEKYRVYNEIVTWRLPQGIETMGLSSPQHLLALYDQQPEDTKGRTGGQIKCIGGRVDCIQV